ncbi:conserved hypothetical protein [Uncinocarpus reesii 1704]|uniref:Uncharacterized protein n=1 Tax=Uncinocarpus reesii (strain UAMH 1704) TaxID=336963 RepID=C4JWW9_UNCRE|nr:uncharacterized protein UREG_06142 [Uncinocarpus reesii 1704]EEP81277.1 conserved hypothetical protein [Uncinocarpus reesii 1704]
MDPDTPPPEPSPSALNYILSFLLVGIAWGFTTPFIRRAAVEFRARNKPNHQDQPEENSARRLPRSSWAKRKLTGFFWTVVNLLRTPQYAVPLLLNLSGSVWFFLLVGKHELSLTVPITNSMAFLFTVLGEWYVEGKVISKQTWLGMSLVLSGIAFYFKDIYIPGLDIAVYETLDFGALIFRRFFVAASTQDAGAIAFVPSGRVAGEFAGRNSRRLEANIARLPNECMRHRHQSFGTRDREGGMRLMHLAELATLVPFQPPVFAPSKSTMPVVVPPVGENVVDKTPDPSDTSTQMLLHADAETTSGTMENFNMITSKKRLYLG